MSFFSCEIATLSLNFHLTILFSLAGISTSFQLGVYLLYLRCCGRPVIFSTLFSLFTSAWCSLILPSIVLSVSPKYFLQEKHVTLYTRTGSYYKNRLPYDKIETRHKLNKFNCKIQFTYKSATNNTLPFLDWLIERDNEGRLQTKIYRKKIHTGQYMHYISNQPDHVKVGTITTLVSRAKFVCSTKESLNDELDYIKKKTMRLNGYPEKLITKTIKKTLSSNSKSKNSQNLKTTKRFLPCEKGILEQLKRIANKYGLEVIFTRFLSLKSKLRTSNLFLL